MSLDEISMTLGELRASSRERENQMARMFSLIEELKDGTQAVRQEVRDLNTRFEAHAEQEAKLAEDVEGIRHEIETDIKPVTDMVNAVKTRALLVFGGAALIGPVAGDQLFKKVVSILVQGGG